MWKNGDWGDEGIKLCWQNWRVLWMSPYVNATLFVNGPLRKCVTKNTVSQDILLIYRGLTRHETIHTNTLARNVILFPKFFWLSGRKKVFYWSWKTFWRSLEQFIRTVKGQNNFWNRMFRTIIFQIWKNNWDLETCRKI